MSDTPNPPAFPIVFEKEDYSHDGMSLRDYFAAKAMQALVSETHTDSIIRAMTMTAYDYADAMLAAREAK